MNILIVGVGGQGTLLTSKVLGEYAELVGLDVKLSEVHGMSQRGGSVVTHVRMGKEVHSPIIWEGGADVILAFEELEGLRYSHYLTKTGILLVNDMKIYPMPVISGSVQYPENIREQLSRKGVNAHFINAFELSMQVGSSKCVNIVMLGALCSALGLDKDLMITAVEKCVPARYKEMNIKALELGFSATEK